MSRALVVAGAIALLATTATSGGPRDSPDARANSLGGYLVFVSNRDGDSDVYGAGANSGRTAALTRNSASEASVLLAPKGGWLAVERGGYGGNVILVSPDGRREHRLGRGENGVFSPDGRLFAFEREGSTLLAATNGRRVRSLGRGVPVSFSPDSRLLAFEIGHEGAGLGVFDLGGDTRRVFAGREEPGTAAWSPDATRLAYLTPEPEEAFAPQDLVVGEAATMAHRVLSTGELGYPGPVWVDNGQIGFVRVVRAENEYRGDEVVVAALEGGERVLASGDFSNVRWAPTRDKVAIEEDFQRLRVTDATTGETRLLGESEYGEFAWAPSGRRIALRRPDRSLVIADADDGSSRTVLHTESSWSLPWDAVWSGDGEAIGLYFGDRLAIVRVADGRLRRVPFTAAGRKEIVGWVAADLPASARKVEPTPLPDHAGARVVRSRGRVSEVAASGSWSAAVVGASRTDCEHVIAWRPGSKIMRFRPPMNSCFGDPFVHLTLRGTRLHWVIFYCGNNCYLADFSANLRRPGEQVGSEDDEEYDGPPPRAVKPASTTRKGIRMSVRNGMITLRRLRDGAFTRIRPPAAASTQSWPPGVVLRVQREERPAGADRLRPVREARAVADQQQDAPPPDKVHLVRRRSRGRLEDGSRAAAVAP